MTWWLRLLAVPTISGLAAALAAPDASLVRALLVTINTVIGLVLLALVAAHSGLRRDSSQRALPKSLATVLVLALVHLSVAWLALRTVAPSHYWRVVGYSTAMWAVTTASIGLNAYVRSLDVPDDKRGADYVVALPWWHYVRGTVNALASLPGVRWAADLLKSSAPENLGGPVAFVVFTLALCGTALSFHQAAAPRGATQPASSLAGAPAGARGATAGPDPDPGQATTPLTQTPVDPTYEDECGPEAAIGEPADATTAAKLRTLVVGDRHLHRDGIGGLVTGCIRPALTVPGHADVVYAEGFCPSGGLRSLLIVSATYPAALLLQGAAKVAQRRAEAGEMLGASGRLAIGGGDFQILHTTKGDRLLIRSAVSSGSSSEEPDTSTCADGPGVYAGYLELTPAQLAAYVAATAQLGRWLWPVLDHKTGALRLVSDQGQQEQLATVTCSADDRCQLTIGSATFTPPLAAVDGCALARRAPPAQLAYEDRFDRQALHDCGIAA